jgi:putative thioredoxin
VLESLLQGTPGDPDLRFRLARLLVFSEPERAMALAERLEPRGVPLEEVQAVRTLGRLFQEEPPPGEQGIDAPGPFSAAVQLLRERDFHGALEALISILREDGAQADPRVRGACVAIFHHLGQDHPLVARFRGEVSRALYV